MSDYDYYKNELLENGYISANNKEWFAWFSKCVMKEYPEVSCMDFSSAGLGQYVVISKSVLLELKKWLLNIYPLSREKLKSLLRLWTLYILKNTEKAGKLNASRLNPHGCGLSKHQFFLCFELPTSQTRHGCLVVIRGVHPERPVLFNLA